MNSTDKYFLQQAKDLYSYNGIIAKGYKLNDNNEIVKA